MALSSRDLDDLKPMVNETVKTFMGFSDPTIVITFLNCLGKGYDKRKTVDNLSQLLDNNQATHLAEKVYNIYDDFRTSGKAGKKRRKDLELEESIKRRRFMDEIEITEISIPPLEPPPPVKPKNTMPNLIPPGSQLTPDKIKEMMANAQKTIQERKIQLGVPNIPTPPPAPKAKINEAEVKAKRAAELQAQIQARLSGMAGTLPPPLIPGLQNLPPKQVPTSALPMAGPSPLILNAEGKTIDAKTGEAIQLTTYTPTLKANIRAKRREQFKDLIEKPPIEISDSKFFDTRMEAKSSQRQKRGFKFHERGKFEQQATRLRAKAQLDRLQCEIASAARKTGIATAAKIATITPRKEIIEGEIPDIEWWDTFIIKGASYELVPLKRNIDKSLLEGVTNLVEHPIQIAPPIEPKAEVAISVSLTKKERKKLRRQNRQEAEKEQQEKIRLGLAPPLEPKVRMANLMRVLGTEAVHDPTKVEAHVRAQMDKRRRGHEEANAARKLTTEQRKEKKIDKIKENTDEGVHVAVYRIRDLTDAAIKFKVEKNAEQLYMTGMTILFKDCNLVVVEGGPKQQRKYRRLMMHRIKWSESCRRSRNFGAGDSDDEDSVDKTNKCVLVWEGMVKSRNCVEMKFKNCPTETFAREQMKKLGIEHYWDLAYSGTVLETAGEDD